jgi:hypothetical protein
VSADRFFGGTPMGIQNPNDFGDFVDFGGLEAVMAAYTPPLPAGFGREPSIGRIL